MFGNSRIPSRYNPMVVPWFTVLNHVTISYQQKGNASPLLKTTGFPLNPTWACVAVHQGTCLQLAPSSTHTSSMGHLGHNFWCPWLLHHPQRCELIVLTHAAMHPNWWVFYGLDHPPVSILRARVHRTVIEVLHPVALCQLWRWQLHHLSMGQDSVREAYLSFWYILKVTFNMYFCVCLVLVLLNIFDSSIGHWHPLTITRFDPGHHHGDQGFSGVDPVLHDMFHEGFACEVLVFTSADFLGRTEDGLQLLWKTEDFGMGLILAKRKCNSGSVCLESLTDAEFFLNLRDMST